VTLGAAGAVIATQDELIQIAGNEVTAVDTNGAGDLFAGAFLHAICTGYSLELAGKLASFASAQLVTQYGARLTAENLSKIKTYLSEMS